MLPTKRRWQVWRSEKYSFTIVIFCSLIYCYRRSFHFHRNFNMADAPPVSCACFELCSLPPTHTHYLHVWPCFALFFSLSLCTQIYIFNFSFSSFINLCTRACQELTWALHITYRCAAAIRSRRSSCQERYVPYVTLSKTSPSHNISKRAYDLKRRRCIIYLLITTPPPLLILLSHTGPPLQDQQPGMQSAGKPSFDELAENKLAMVSLYDFKQMPNIDDAVSCDCFPNQYFFTVRRSFIHFLMLSHWF